MNLDIIAYVALGLATVPCGLFLVNLLVYRPLPRRRHSEEAESLTLGAPPPPHVGGYGSYEVSVLIPARNEEANIRGTLEAVLANRGVNLEVVVLDDHSTDRTVEVVGESAARDSRVRLELAPPLPAGWCGKQHACHVLAQRARSPLLVFMDADVRLAADALERMVEFMEGGKGKAQKRVGNNLGCESSVALCLPPQSKTALASGVPRQELGTFAERLLIPQIHFILLGYLPMPFMRWTNWPAFSAGCGQLFIARRDAYEATGGHAMIRATLHDGVKLPRLFRRAGFNTGLFDATDAASCRMYHSNGETWRGLGKNATEGLAAPGTILPMTILLFGGQVLPFLLVALTPLLSASGLTALMWAGVCAYLPRLLAVWLFRQPLDSALLHPLGVTVLLVIQWLALARQLAGKPAVWKGRAYVTSAPSQPAQVA